MTPASVFLWGCGGSVAVEVVNLVGVYERPRIAIPQRYRRVGFYAARFFLMLVAGGLAVAYGIDKPVLAVNLGAATPLLIQALARGVAGRR